MRGEFTRGRRIVEDGLALGRELDMHFVMTGMLIMLGDLASAENWDAAARAYRETLEPSRGTTPAQIATAVRRVAAICPMRGDHRRAVHLVS